MLVSIEVIEHIRIKGLLSIFHTLIQHDIALINSISGETLYTTIIKTVLDRFIEKNGSAEKAGSVIVLTDITVFLL